MRPPETLTCAVHGGAEQRSCSSSPSTGRVSILTWPHCTCNTACITCHTCHVSRPRPHLLCSARYVAPWTTGSLLPAAGACLPAACPPLALLRRHLSRDTPKVACREHQRYTYTHTAHMSHCHTVTLVTGTAPYRSLSHTL